MAQESDLPKTADKGKGKAVDDEKKPQDVDGKTPANGKKEEDQNGGFLGLLRPNNLGIGAGLLLTALCVSFRGTQ